jgi:hypothetical protein
VGVEYGEYDGLVEIFCQDCGCKIMRSYWPDDPKTSEELVKSAIETWNTRHGQSVNKSKRGDVWNLEVYVKSPLEWSLARDKFQAAITILEGQPFSGANSRLIMFIKWSGILSVWNSGGAAGAEIEKYG